MNLYYLMYTFYKKYSPYVFAKIFYIKHIFLSTEVWTSKGVDTWCTIGGRGQRYGFDLTEEQCKTKCVDDCIAVEYWTSGVKGCFECTKLTLVQKFGTSWDTSYPPIVFFKSLGTYGNILYYIIHVFMQIPLNV